MEHGKSLLFVNPNYWNNVRLCNAIVDNTLLSEHYVQ